MGGIPAQQGSELPADRAGCAHKTAEEGQWQQGLKYSRCTLLCQGKDAGPELCLDSLKQ